MNSKKIITSLMSGIFLFFSTSQIFAADGANSGSPESIIKISIALVAFLIVVVLWLIFVFSETTETEAPSYPSPIKRFLHMITQTVPLTEESKILMDHEYDGIRELNNKLPPWFVALFYATIIFAVVYMVNYHVLGDGNVMENEYMEEVNQAKMEQQLLTKSSSSVDEESVTLLNDDASIAEGKNIFLKNCVACHGQNGEGLIGPNFTDDYWIHGGGIKNVFHTIKYGVPAKGMISWKAQLSPNQMQQVGSYILSLRGTNPANQKAPQGELWTPDKVSK